MTDPKAPLGGKDDLDWDAALDEWEKTSFTPERAKDKETDQPGVLTGAKPATAPRGATPAPTPIASPAARPAPPLPPRPKPRPPVPLPGLLDTSLEEDEVTSVAEVPPSTPSLDPPPVPARSKGGLRQLFGRPSEPADAASRPPSPPPAAGRPHSAPKSTDEIDSLLDDGPLADFDPSVVTSAPDAVAQGARSLPDERLKRPISSNPPIADGAMFDPFAESATGHAEDEPHGERQEAPTAPPPGSRAAADAALRIPPHPPPLRRPVAPPLLAPEDREHDPDMETGRIDTRKLALPIPDPSAYARARMRSPFDTKTGEELEAARRELEYEDEVTRVERGEELVADSRQLKELEELEQLVEGAEPSELEEVELDAAEQARLEAEAAEAAAAEEQAEKEQAAADELAHYTGSDRVVDEQATADAVSELASPPSILPPSMPPVPTLSSPPPPFAVARKLPAFDEERPAEEWLDEPTRRATAERAAWLEAEAGAAETPTAQARLLLVVSELHASLGDRATALTHALKACELAPELALAHEQAIALTPPEDVPALLTRIATASRVAAGPSVKAHLLLEAADIARLAGDTDAARAQWSEALDAAPDDLRVLLAHSAQGLAAGAHGDAARGISEAATRAKSNDAGGEDEATKTAVFATATAVRTALRLRGTDRERSETDLAFVAPDALRRARLALAVGDLAGAGAALGELASLPELAPAARWLSAALSATRPDGRRAALDLLASLEGRSARRVRAALALQMGDGERAREIADDTSTFAASERLALALLLNAGPEVVSAALGEVSAITELTPLAAAVSGSVPSSDLHLPGEENAQRAVHLARVLARGASNEIVDAAISAREVDSPDEMRALRIDAAARANRWSEVTDAVAAWGAGAERDARLLAGLVAERAGEIEQAARHYRAAAEQGTANDEAALRAAAALDPAYDLAGALTALGERRGDGVAAAMAFVEAVTLGPPSAAPDEGRDEKVRRAHAAAPALPFANFLAERFARQRGDVDAVLSLLRTQRAESDDAIERALDSIREALLVADTDPSLATERLEEAHKSRPADVALRELYERLAIEPPTDRASWREARASDAKGDAKVVLLLEATHEYERTSDAEGALRAAQAAVAAAGQKDALSNERSSTLPHVVLERTEIRAGAASRLSDELLAQARSASDLLVRREAYERLADLDLTGRNDAASALLWHRSILEESPEHLPSLRYVEHALLSEGRDDEVEPIASSIAKCLLVANPGDPNDVPGSPDALAHAALAARLRMRRGDWAATSDLAELATRRPNAPLWALRLRYAHARTAGDAAAELAATTALLGRVTRPAETASLRIRAADAAKRAGELERARELAESATSDDPTDFVAFDKLLTVHRAAGDARGAAETLENIARVSNVQAHRLAAWHEAGVTWLEQVGDESRGIAALEHAATIDVSFADVFPRLSRAYARKGSRSELAQLLEKRVGSLSDPAERIELEVERGRVLAEVGDPGGARRAFEAALELAPDHENALRAYGGLCAEMADWEAAEQAWVRLARLLSSPDEQRAVYERLGELYATHAVNLSRAEVALKEVLKRAPDDLPTLEKLVDVYQRQNDAAHALEFQQQLIARAANATDRRRRLIELARILEDTARDNRKAEQALETARREFPADVTVLRALAEFYTRHKQMPAVHILLDRTSGDARRAFTAGRFAPSLFETMATVYELRGKLDAANAVRAALAAFTGEPGDLRGAEARAGDSRLDDVLAPEVVIPALRALLARTGDALDAVVPLDPRSVRAAALPPSAAATGAIASSLAVGMGIQGLQVLVSPQLGQTCVPATSSPPTIILGEALLAAPNVLARTFLIARALKLVQARASALLRIPAKDLPLLVSAWLHVFNPNWSPPGVNSAVLADAAKKLQAALPRRLDQDVGLMALEVAGSVGTHAAALGPAVVAWADRTALLVVGSPSAALDGIAWSLGQKAAPPGAQERAAWIARTNEAREIIAFAVSEPYVEARVRAGVSR